MKSTVKQLHIEDIVHDKKRTQTEERREREIERHRDSERESARDALWGFSRTGCLPLVGPARTVGWCVLRRCPSLLAIGAAQTRLVGGMAWRGSEAYYSSISNPRLKATMPRYHARSKSMPAVGLFTLSQRIDVPLGFANGPCRSHPLKSHRRKRAPRPDSTSRTTAATGIKIHM